MRRKLSNLCAVVLAGLCALAIVGCSEARTAEEIKRNYALKILEGFSVGFSDVRAERADPTTYRLYDLTVRSGDQLIHAESADILVNVKSGSVALSLKGVTGADAEAGNIFTLGDVRTDAFRIAVKD